MPDSQTALLAWARILSSVEKWQDLQMLDDNRSKIEWAVRYLQIHTGAVYSHNEVKERAYILHCEARRMNLG